MIYFVDNKAKLRGMLSKAVIAARVDRWDKSECLHSKRSAIKR